ncbi:hypothetical protein L207DRAFT_511594 [Hyaloscypha variabilis F]|uniref:Uncharacterized protein n=1 Tax=Hyaloscypha variabilis (strain UAMH 11265 / GT02V1 / F) TaxID=1149755 RepID=A0A2J6RTG0_HYAVF|nr:hypothetical protein L207DRAFT_511594 [Hyaloscypha variabilis F]
MELRKQIAVYVPSSRLRSYLFCNKPAHNSYTAWAEQQQCPKPKMRLPINPCGGPCIARATWRGLVGVVQAGSSVSRLNTVHLTCAEHPMSLPSPQSHQPADKSKTSLPPTFPLPEKPKCCWAREHMAPAKIDCRAWTSLARPQSITRPYYICTTCDNNKCNILRDSGYPRGFITWDDGIGIYPRNPRCYCGFPSRQDRKGGKANSGGEGFWVCASGACDYFSDRKDGVPYEDAKMLLDFDAFHPYLLERIPPYC